MFLFKKISDILPYNTKNCSFIASDYIGPINAMNKTDYFYISYPKFSEKIYNEWAKRNNAKKLILGPNFVPSNWYHFPNTNIWKERRFKEIISKIKGIAVHTDRVKNHLIQHSNTKKFFKKYINIRPCSNLSPKSLKNFDERNIDIIFFEKYADLDHRAQGKILLSLLNNTNKRIEILKYGYYNKSQMQEIANNSKFIIYFSFFDAGPIGLMEIQNHGVFLFTHQKELIFDNRTGLYIPELADERDMHKSFQIIVEKIEKIKFDSKKIGKINQENHKCQKALEDLCKGIFK